jgi:hypothetical protein
VEESIDVHSSLNSRLSDSDLLHFFQYVLYLVRVLGVLHGFEGELDAFGKSLLQTGRLEPKLRASLRNADWTTVNTGEELLAVFPFYLRELDLCLRPSLALN